ncbi:hypothetical protein HYW20_02320 [Candidatus Woesearchaeota archaeon]|nr:hypothetical protein [Candidatus Woesearchaeota archaeon]
MVIEILKGVSFRMKKIKEEVMEEYDISFNNKNLSEIIGKIMEKVASDVFTKRLGYEVKRALADRDKDLVFTQINKPMEIKMTSTENAWTGGEFSQRAPDYLLVSWGGNFDEFFCCLVKLDKSDWESNISKRFYGPTLKAKTVYNKKDKVIFYGNFEVTKRNAIKLKREKI